MERAKYILIILLLSSFTVADPHGGDILKMFLSGDMVAWKKKIDQMEQQPAKSKETIFALLDYQYGYIGYCIGAKKQDEARKYMKLAWGHLETLQKGNYKPSWIHAYQSALYGYEIGLNKLKAPVLGPKCVESAKKAIALDTNNPFGYTQYGNTQLYMPAMFGGSALKAIQSFARAEKIYDRNHTASKQDWNYLNLLVTIAMAYETLGYQSLAIRYYQKILKIAPDFLWVKNDLYPKALKKK
jgi:tetratricopeptide (TPR) repeat protein